MEISSVLINTADSPNYDSDDGTGSRFKIYRESTKEHFNNIIRRVLNNENADNIIANEIMPLPKLCIKNEHYAYIIATADKDRLVKNILRVLCRTNNINENIIQFVVGKCKSSLLEFEPYDFLIIDDNDFRQFLAILLG